MRWDGSTGGNGGGTDAASCDGREQVRAAAQSERDDLCRVSWQPAPISQSVVAPEKVVVVGGAGRLAAASIAASALRRRLTALPEKERLGALVGLVQEVVAAVLGLAGAAAVPAGRPLKELGLDSLMAVEVRNQLSARAETTLPTTLVFDHPTPDAIARLLLRQAFAELGAAGQAQSVPRLTNDEAIAIVSMSCRVPGGVIDVEGYWALLAEGRDVIGPFPERWDTQALYDPDPEARGKSYAREGGFLRDVDQFDADFFGISPREAVSMDPQQRLVLEVAWEALERAGLRPGALNGSSTGVYLGSMGSDYGQGNASLESLDGYVATGQASSVLSGRVSYALGLQGPAMTVDTACSSSLVALHLACAGLRQGECDLALAGGVQVMSTPTIFVEFSRLRGMAPDGRCKSFSEKADGAGWSEGCGILVLKRLSDAERDGDRVLAVVRGSAVNQDGRSQGLTAPNGPSQQRLIGRALAVSGLAPSDIDAVEAHGTGTTLGDPIEAGALAEVFGPTRREGEPLYIGSSKSNLGHTSAAAGALGVMKMVLALQHERLPKTLHAETPSRHIAWEGSGLSLLQEARPWPRRAARRRRAGVSSFGVSGTNAHAIVEEAPLRSVPVPTAARVEVCVPLLVSGRDEEALRAQAWRWAAWLAAHPDAVWADVVRTAALHRTHFERRAALFVDDIAQATQALTALAEGRPHADVVEGQARALGGVVFVFPGQGSQWPAMGRGLWEQSAAFREAVSACDAALRPHTGWSVAAVLRGEEADEVPPLGRVDVVQPALFTMGVALAAVWRSLGLEPAAVVGASQGEAAAAVVAGALSLEDGARVTALRSRLLLPLAGSGGMAAVELPVEEVTKQLDEHLSVAVVNTPTSTVVSGDKGAIETFVARLSQQGVFCRPVDVDYASHSRHMDAVLDELHEKLDGVSPQAAKVPMISTLTGAQIDGTELDARYWCRNLREAVRLDRALQVLLSRNENVFVEVSSHPVLAMPLTTACADGAGVVVGTLRRDAEGRACLNRALGGLHVHGYGVDWQSMLGGSGSGHVDLPTYAFQRQRYWWEELKSRVDIPSLGLSATGHPILRVASPLAGSEGELFSGRLSLSEHGWLADHKVFDRVILPGTGIVDLAIAAGLAVGSSTVLELTLVAALMLPAKGGLRVQVQVEAADAQGRRALSLHSRAEAAGDGLGGWTRHAVGVLGAPGEAGKDTSAITLLEDWPPAGAVPLDVGGLYARLSARGLDYGPAFRGLTGAWRVGDVIYGEVTLPAGMADTAGDYGIHPALFDAAWHVVAAAQEF